MEKSTGRIIMNADLSIPPSSNKIYINAHGRGRILSTEARSWKREALKELSQQVLGLQTYPNSPHALMMNFYFKRIETDLWKQGKSIRRWTKIDLDNRIKLLEDTVKECTGVDDSAIMLLAASKKQSENERVRVVFMELDSELSSWEVLNI